MSYIWQVRRSWRRKHLIESVCDLRRAGTQVPTPEPSSSPHTPRSVSLRVHIFSLWPGSFWVCCTLKRGFDMLCSIWSERPPDTVPYAVTPLPLCPLTHLADDCKTPNENLTSDTFILKTIFGLSSIGVELGIQEPLAPPQTGWRGRAGLQMGGPAFALEIENWHW
jgi:hypothetical protein